MAVNLNPPTTQNTSFDFGSQQAQGRYYQQYKRYYSKLPRSTNALENTLIVLIILFLIISSVLGFMDTGKQKRDSQKREDILNLIEALEEFYANSRPEQDKRFYPIALCSENPNEIDYEWTLRRHLTGQNKNVDTHMYIAPSDFPRDQSGVYNKLVSDRALPFKCSQVLSSDQEGQVYQDGYPSCNFSTQKPKFKNCYLYVSSNNGDSFSLGYYSQSQNSFIIFSKFRETDLVQTNLSRF